MDEKEQKELQELRVFVDGLRNQYNKTKDVFDKIDDLQFQYQKATDVAAGIVQEGQDFKDKLTSTEEQAKKAYSEVEKIKTTIAEHLSSADGSIAELQKISTQSAELSGAVKGQKESIDSQLSLAKSAAEQTEKYKTSAEQNLEKANSVLTDFQEKAEQMKIAYAEFLEIKKKIDDKDTGLQVALELVQKANDSADILIEEIRQLKTEIVKTESEVKTIHQKSTATLTSIEKNAKTIEEKKAQIEEVTGITIDGTFANKFEKRKNEIEKSLNHDIFSWKNILFFAVFTLVLAVFLPFTNAVNTAFSFNQLAGIDGFLLRFFYTSPLVFLVVFSAVQYSRERTFLEKYAFKSASASAIRNHTEFLTEKFEPSEVLKFTTDVFASIYKEPFEEQKDIRDKKEQTVRDPVSLDLVESIEKLKVIIPDEVLLKKVLDIVSSNVKN